MFRTAIRAALIGAISGLALPGPALAQDTTQHHQHMHGMGEGMPGAGMPGMGAGCPMYEAMMAGQAAGGMGGMETGGGDEGPASMAYRGANMKMHRDMAITYSGNADVDFVKGMIPHHQGAIDMAKTVIAFGSDPQVRKLAEEVIKAQEAEIAMMREWLKKNGQ